MRIWDWMGIGYIRLMTLNRLGRWGQGRGPTLRSFCVTKQSDVRLSMRGFMP